MKVIFTGIIEEIGIVKEFRKSTSDALVVVECKKALEDTKIGDSIAINGVCQTVTALNSSSFTAQISSETLLVTTFSTFKTGETVNLERALTLKDRLGGHIVTGHVDGLAKVLKITKQSDFYTIEFEVSKDFTKYIAKKGSVTINGVSLTVANVVEQTFEVAIIPHTFENTNLQALRANDFVNLETDILSKYVEKILSTGDNNSNASIIDENFLKENGFF